MEKNDSIISHEDTTLLHMTGKKETKLSYQEQEADKQAH